MTAQLEYKVIVPPPLADEDPVSYADRLGTWYANQVSNAERKKRGIFFTPPPVARFMGRLCRGETAHFVRLLDPSAGAGILAAACATALGESALPPRHIELICHETEPVLIPLLERVLVFLRERLAERKIRLRYRVEAQDFLLAHGSALRNELFEPTPRFDAVICNPPYFKLSKSDPRARLCAAVVHGQPNIYGLFMAVGAALLREGGRFVFITPRSYASGPYFRRLRERFFHMIRPTDIHVFESRTDAFSDVLQETAITAGTRRTGWQRNASGLRIRLSSSKGAEDVQSAAARTLPLPAVLRGDCEHRVLHFPADRMHDTASALVRTWRGSLQAYGWKISTGPVVAFRAARYLRTTPDRHAVPLLWLQHVKPMAAVWPAVTRKPQYLHRCADSSKLVLPNRNCVLLRRFSAKEERRRLVAAPLLARALAAQEVAFENHLNYIHKPVGQLSADEAYGLAALLNSTLLDTYFRISSGNTQVSATEIRAMPLPDLAVIRRIGSRARAEPLAFDAIVRDETGYDG